MGQSEILELLEEKKKPLSTREICKFLNSESSKISHSIKKLIAQNEIKFIELKVDEAREIFGDEAPYHKMKLYFVKKGRL